MNYDRMAELAEKAYNGWRKERLQEYKLHKRASEEEYACRNAYWDAKKFLESWVEPPEWKDLGYRQWEWNSVINALKDDLK